MGAVYNELDGYCVRWLENLIAAGLIAPGRVDGRSIVELHAADVAGPGQRHFFAGIAGWSLGLRLAGVPDSASIWTGSCPCQGLSVAGSQRGADDPRHLWPAWYRLIAECRPPVILGEQTGGALGRAWLAAVRHDLEGLGYAVGASDLAAASVSAPHIRQRQFFGAFLGVGQADTDSTGWLVEWRRRLLDRERSALGYDPDGCGPAGNGVGHGQAVGRGAGRTGGTPRRPSVEPAGPGDDSDRLGVGVGVGHAACVAARPAQGPVRRAGTDGHGLGLTVGHGAGRRPGTSPGQEAEGDGQRVDAGRVGDLASSPGGDHPWTDAELIACHDPKRGLIYRPAPTDPRIPVVAHVRRGGHRVAKLRAGGNAIVPQVAAQFIGAFLEAVADTRRSA